ncbi:MAG: hypothetical protein ABI824_03380 [Acidobacteriota bacterium]
MKQPALGLVATALVIVISLGFISLFDFAQFSGWVSYLLICLIPMEIVVGVAWGANPAFASKMAQPMKGLLLVLVTVVGAAIIAPIMWQVAGAGVSPPAPMLMLCMIVSVVVMFWMAIMFGGWPFTAMFKNPVASGIAMWVACYVVNYGLFRVLFNFDFMKGAPVYVAAADPGGMFNGTDAMVVYVTVVAVLFLLLHFDLWPLTTSPGLMKQPTLGVVWTLLAVVIGGGAYYIGVVSMGMDPMMFLIRVPIPFVFGTIVMLNMMHNSVFASLHQPVKGVANAVSAAVVGTLLERMYEALLPTVTGHLTAGPPGNDLERWVASAMLAVTFPFFIFYAEFFKMWPLMSQEKPKA